MYLQGSVYDLGLSFLNIDEQSWKETDDYQIVKNHYFQKLKKKKERKQIYWREKEQLSSLATGECQI